jgi:hypothetical protein
MTSQTTNFVDNIDGFHRAFFDLEKRLDLFEWQVDGIPLWERLRTSVYRSILNSIDIHGARHNTTEKTMPHILKGAYLWARNIVLRNPLVGGEHDILVWGHQRRKQFNDGYWWDIYTDPLFDAVDLDYQQMETAYRLNHHRPAKTSNLDYLDLITYSSTIYRKLSRGDGRLDSPMVDTIEEQFAEEFDVDIDVGRLAYEKITDRKIYLPLYQRILRRVNPEIVLTVVGYSKETFIEACRREGIPVVELQHGFLGDYHIGYSFPEGISKVYKPDYMFSFGPYWTDAVPMFDTDDVFNVGYQHFESGCKKNYNIQRTNELLFISQGVHGHELSKVATDLAIDYSHDFDIIYKLHPTEYNYWKEEYPWLAESAIDVVQGDVDLYELQARARAQLGVNSTALFEGLRFGTPVVLFETNGICRMSRLINEYDIPVVSDAGELLEVIPTLDEQQVDPRMFFTENPSEKFEEAIETIRNK